MRVFSLFVTPRIWGNSPFGYFPCYEENLSVKMGGNTPFILMFIPVLYRHFLHRVVGSEMELTTLHALFLTALAKSV
jgi:hypothetical protein